MRFGPVRIFLFLLFAIILGGCGGPSPTIEAARTLDAPSVFRVSATAESSFSGPVSDLEGATNLTAAFKTMPVSDSAVEVEVLYAAASVRDAGGEPVALGLGQLAGKKATVEFRPPGVVTEVRGDDELLEAPIPLISPREVIWGLFPPLPGEAMEAADTWTGDVPVAFANIDGSPTRMRYVLEGVNASANTGRVGGYELSLGPRSFEAETPAGPISGRGDLEAIFEGELLAREGYERTERTVEFDTRQIRLADSASYANGNLHLKSTTVTERLNSAEQFGLDAGNGR